MDGSDSSVEVVRSQHIKDVKLALEYKYLIKAAPTGIYLLPEFDNIGILHGVIFVRRGIYRDGVFRFRIDLPKAYNDVNTFPLVTFTPPIFNPLVDISTGKLDYGADELFREWNPEKHHLVTLITFIKKIFFLKSYSEFSRVANKQASDLFQHDREEFMTRASKAVEESLQRVYDSHSPNNPLVFTEPKPAHEDLVKQIFLERARNQDSQQKVEILERDKFDELTEDSLSYLHSHADEQLADLSADSIASPP